MKNKNKAIAASIVLLSLTSSFAYGEYSPKKDNSTQEKVENVDTYTMYLSEFMEEFEDDLKDGDFEDIEEKIRGYKGDIKYLSQNKESEHYINLGAYQTKLKALEDLRSRYTSVDLSEEQEDAKEKIREKQKEKREEMKKKMEDKKENIKEKQEEIKEEVEEKRKEAKEKLEEMKDSRKEMVKKHKEKYEGVLSQKLKTISEGHIKVVISRIDKKISDIESTNMRETRKQNITAKLEAIKLILEERLSETEYKIDLDSLFSE